MAIGEAIEVELQGRHGNNQYTEEEVENIPPPAGKTRDLAAKAAGFGNGKTYEQAKQSHRAKPEGEGGVKSLGLQGFRTTGGAVFSRPQNSRVGACRNYRQTEASNIKNHRQVKRFSYVGLFVG